MFGIVARRNVAILPRLGPTLPWQTIRTSNLSTSTPSQGTWAIPDRLKDIPTADNPGFFEMVEYYFHKAWYIFVCHVFVNLA